MTIYVNWVSKSASLRYLSGLFLLLFERGGGTINVGIMNEEL